MPAKLGVVVLQDNEAHLLWFETRNVGQGDWSGLLAMLDEDERGRAEKFHFERDRESFILAHALGRGLLSLLAGGAPSSWRFEKGPHGKPEAVCVAAVPRWRLNLSHTRGMAAAALALDHDVGVDVEWLGRDPDCLALSKRFFAAQEDALLNALPADRQTDAFLTIWTLKESYVKAIGKGLAQPLDSFHFTLDPPTVHFNAIAHENSANWLFQSVRPNDGHILALALRHPCPQNVVVNAKPASLEALLRL